MKGNKTRNGYVVYSTVYNVEKKLFLQTKKGLRKKGKKIKKVWDLEKKERQKSFCYQMTKEKRQIFSPFGKSVGVRQ